MNEIINIINKKLEKNLNYKKTSEDLIEIYFMIGKYLEQNKLGYETIYKLEESLRNKYGLVIGFTKRNLLNMLKFYQTYNTYNLDDLKQVTWNKHLLIQKQNNKKELLDYCIKYNISKKSLEKIIKNGFNIEYIDKKTIEDDNMTLEFICLKK